MLMLKIININNIIISGVHGCSIKKKKKNNTFLQNCCVSGSSRKELIKFEK